VRGYSVTTYYLPLRSQFDPELPRIRRKPKGVNTEAVINRAALRVRSGSNPVS